MSDKLIKASDAVDVVAKHSALYGNGEVSTDEGETLLYDIMSEIMNLPSAQTESTRTFVELVVEYPDPELCTYKEYKGKPYFSIKYMENGKEYVGYGTYSPKVLSRYLREYFMPSAQPDPKWIPFGQSAENDEDRATDDQIADSGKMIKLKKRTITERLIIANSLIAGAIADSDNNQFCDSTKMTDSEDVWEDGYCNYADRKNKDVPDTNVGDMISRQAAIDAVWNGMCIFYDCDVIRNLKALPSAQPEPKTGEWIFLDECSNEGVYCSKCGKKVFRLDFSNTMQKWKNYKFCPNCGARMEGVSE